MNARVWDGFHFGSARNDGKALGHTIVNYAFTHQVQPTD